MLDVFIITIGVMKYYIKLMGMGSICSCIFDNSVPSSCCHSPSGVLVPLNRPLPVFRRFWSLCAQILFLPYYYFGFLGGLHCQICSPSPPKSTFALLLEALCSWLMYMDILPNLVTPQIKGLHEYFMITVFVFPVDLPVPWNDLKCQEEQRKPLFSGVGSIWCLNTLKSYIDSLWERLVSVCSNTHFALLSLEGFLRAKESHLLPYSP